MMTYDSSHPNKDQPPLVTLERFLPYRMNVLAHLVAGAVAAIYKKQFNLTLPQWRVIATLGEYGVHTGRDIAVHALMHKSTVSRAVASLQTRHLVEGLQNLDDKREDLLQLTQEGRKIYEALAPEALSFAEKLWTVFSKEERATFFNMIDRLDKHAKHLVKELHLDIEY